MMDKYIPEDSIPVLLICTDPVKIEALGDALREQSLDITTVSGLREGMERIGHQPFAMVIVDFQLTGVGGFEAIRRIREMPEAHSMPILLISASKPIESELRRGYNLGIADFLYIPLNITALNTRVRMLAGDFREALSIREHADSMRRHSRALQESGGDGENRLRKMEEDYALIFGNIKDYAIFMLDPKGRISSWNPGAEQLLGYSEDQILGHEVKVLFTAEDNVNGESNREIKSALENGRAEDERWHVRRDGSRFWASGILNRVLDQHGKLRGFVKIMRDQTERENAREKLRESEERNRRLIEEIQEYAIIMLDPEGKVLSWNKGAGRLLGYRAHEIIGRNFSVIYTPEDLSIDKPARELKDALELGRSMDSGLRVRKEGSRFWSEEIISPIRNDEGALTGYTKIIRDTTLQKQIEEARASQVRYLEGMDAISAVLEQNLDMEQVLQLAVEKVMSLFDGTKAFLIHPLSEDGARLHVPYSAEKAARPGYEIREEIDRDSVNPGFEEALLSSTEPIILESDFPIRGLQPCRPDPGGSLAAVVIRPKSDKPWALAVIHCPSRGEWSETDRRLFKDISQRLAGVLDNLLLHRNLQASEERFRWLVENTTEIIWRMEMRQPVPVSLPVEEQVERFYRDGYLAECNDALARRYGHSVAAELIGSSLDRLLPKAIPANRAFLSNFIRSRYRSLEIERSERGRDGRPRYLVYNLVGMLTGGLLTGAWGTGRDITDRRLAEEEMRRSRDQLDVILQGIADAILVYSPSGALVYFNEAAARMMEFPAQPSERKDDARMKEALDRVEIMDENGKPMPLEKRPVRLALQGLETPPTLLRYRTGSQGLERWLITRAKPILDNAGKVRMVISIAQDTTELRKAEEQFRQSQKMEAVGRLAGGVAHDFNNMLTAINGYADLLLGMTERDDSRKLYLEEIRKAGERAATLTNQLLVYSRRQILTPRAVDLNAVVSQMEMMLRRLIGEDIDLSVRPDPHIDNIKADPGQIEQVILNLVVNARDAMPKGGRLGLETDQVEMAGEPACINEPAISGEYVRLTVRDSGFGMDEAVKAHLFEPFFTTKKTGRGTGLGLSTVYGIVRQSGGCIGVDSEKGKGAVFRVYFPATGAIGRPKKPKESRPGQAELSGSETILVAEDDPAVRSLVKDILESYGYHVLEADNGLDALETANAHRGPIELLLTDVVMAQMGGRELTDRMKLIRPDLKTIYMSGHTDDAIIRHGVFTKTETFLHKPFTPESLAGKVRMVLDSVPA